MPGRVEYFDDPTAPRANSLVVAVTAVVTNERGELLLQKRTDNDLWGLPGGAMNIGESIGQAVIREVREAGIFTVISAITFVVTLIPDFTYIPTVPGSSPAQTAILVLMHVIAATVIVRLLTSTPVRRAS
jgi:8-oxo-dGTP pyrophosphatase MutT (NUDIX family)